MTPEAAWTHELYVELRRMAEGLMAGERSGHTLEPTALANEVWLQIHGLTSLTVLKLLVHTAPGHEEALLEATLESIERWLAPAPSRRS